MIHGIELRTVYHVLNVGHLDNRKAITLQQQLKTTNKTVEIGNVSEHVVGMNQVGVLVFARQTRSQLCVKELIDSWNAPLFARDAGNIRGRLDSEDRNPRLFVILEQVSVVARY